MAGRDEHGRVGTASPGRELRANPDVSSALKAFKVGGVYAVKKGGTAGAPRPFEDGRAVSIFEQIFR